ncbi:hypothetical protein ACIGCM_00315 [Pseudomonas sp. NPDC078700]|uniref:hypothetical protein n=1 Tax=Pseudomonas sp. NPDC078700 TaxID=3364424 RepID=UPI0037C92526
MNTPRDDSQVLEHYRQHQRQEPSAALDASILAAANAQAHKVKPATVWMRLHSWLFAGGQGRWSVALGSFVVVGLAVGLVFNGYQQQPAAPAMERYAAPAPALKSAPQADSVPLQRKALQANEAADEAMAASPPGSQAKLSSSTAVDTDDLKAQLQRLIELRRDGLTQQAEALYKALQVQYPSVDVEQELQQLHEQDKSPLR